MNYYRFYYSMDNDEVGRTSSGAQIKLYPDKVLDERSDAFRNIPENRFSEVMPNLNHFTLDDKAKLTDLLSPFHGPRGFFVSEKLKNVFSYHRLPPHKYYQAVIKHKNKFYDHYFFIHLVWDYTEHLDYQQSDFILCEAFSEKVLETIKFSSKAAMDAKWTELRKQPIMSIHLKPYCLVFLPEVDLDLMKIPIYYYCSEILKESLKDQGITGLEITYTNLIGIP